MTMIWEDTTTAHDPAICIATAAETSEAFWATATDHDDEGFISFDRCTDWLLDLYRATEDTDVRLLITEVLTDLREIGPVEGAFEDVVLGALASVEIAFELSQTGARP